MNQKISIITVVYNDEKHIGHTIESVINQTFPNIEYLIIDGGSNDATVEVINTYKSKIQVVVSEPDKGIYDAMNKGIALSSGDWLLFINSGDYIKTNHSIEQIHPYLSNPGGAEIIYGDVSIFSEEFNVMHDLKARDISVITNNTVMSHQACFIKRDLIANNKYDLRYKIAADYHFVLKCFLAGVKIMQLPETISVISSGGISDANRLRAFKEFLKIRNELNKSFRNNINYYKEVCYMQFIKIIKKIIPHANYSRLYKYKYKIK